MKRVLLDTNAYTAFKIGNNEVLEIIRHTDIVGINTIVLGELTAGFHCGTKTKENIKELNAFLDKPRVQIYSIDQNTIPFYAMLYSNLRSKGKPIPTNDLWIAATALQQGCILCSFDTHFHHIENLNIATTLNDFLL